MTAHAEPRKSHIQRSFSDKVIDVITYIVYAFFAFVCVFPFYYLIINSISANNLSERGKVIFWPLEIHFTNYKNLSTIPGLTDAALVSVLRTLVGTIFTVLIAAFLGYMFTRQTLWKRKFWYRFVAITMYFNAGIIPWYLAMKTIGMTNNFWGYIFPTVIQPFYIILCKTYCEGVPQALQSIAIIRTNATIGSNLFIFFLRWVFTRSTLLFWFDVLTRMNPKTCLPHLRYVVFAKPVLRIPLILSRRPDRSCH